MATAKIVSESAQYVQTTDGDSITKTIQLKNVSGSGDNFLVNAGDSVLVPDLDDAHPVKTLLKCRSITATDLGNGHAQVVVEYLPFSGSSQSSASPPTNNDEAIIWNMNFTLESRSVVEDKDGTDITVAAPTAEAAGDGPATETIEVEKRVPIGVIRGERRELDPPMSRMRSNIGKVNSVSHGSYAAKTLLLQGITADTDNTSPDSSPSTYDGWHRVTYEFAYNPDTWDVEVYWTRFDGRQPAAHDDNSQVVYEIYDEVNFQTALDLTFTDPS